ncbi:hypothetical protein GJAV_G00077550 [Gymnothorax javanicus]|nr:hypothetical protein GJAV_G00077550 [Gymnothorax javanicus]
MEGAALVCLLCLQSCLLVNTLNYVDKETSKLTVERRREHVGSDAIKALPAEGTGLKSLESSAAQLESGPVLLANRERRDTDSKGKKKKSRTGGYSLVGGTAHIEATEAPSAKRVSRDTESNGKKKKYRSGGVSLFSTKRVGRGTDSKIKRPRVGLGAFSVISIIMEPTRKPAPSRQKRELQRDRNQKLYYPGGTSVTGKPMRLMMAERSRRQLPTSKTKPKRKPRVGSFSLLSHKQPKSLQFQVTRVRRQLDKKKKKPPGRHSVLGEGLPPNTAAKIEEASATKGDED